MLINLSSLDIIVCLVFDVITFTFSICVYQTQHFSTQKVLLTQKSYGTDGSLATTFV